MLSRKGDYWRLARAVLLPGASVVAALIVTGLLAWIAGADPQVRPPDPRLCQPLRRPERAVFRGHGIGG